MMISRKTGSLTALMAAAVFVLGSGGLGHVSSALTKVVASKPASLRTHAEEKLRQGYREGRFWFTSSAATDGKPLLLITSSMTKVTGAFLGIGGTPTDNEIDPAYITMAEGAAPANPKPVNFAGTYSYVAATQSWSFKTLAVLLPSVVPAQQAALQAIVTRAVAGSTAQLVTKIPDYAALETRVSERLVQNKAAIDAAKAAGLPPVPALDPFEEHLADDEWVEDFMNYLGTEFSQENLSFLFAVRGLDTSSPAAEAAGKRWIFNEFVNIAPLAANGDVSAPRQINISSKKSLDLRAKVCATPAAPCAIPLGPVAGPVVGGVPTRLPSYAELDFRDAYAEVKSLMASDSARRFRAIPDRMPKACSAAGACDAGFTCVPSAVAGAKRYCAKNP